MSEHPLAEAYTYTKHTYTHTHTHTHTHTQQTNNHALSRIRTRDLRNQSAENYALDPTATGISDEII